MDLTVSTKQKLIVNIQKEMKTESKHNTNRVIKPQGKREKGERKEIQKVRKQFFKLQ